MPLSREEFDRVGREKYSDIYSSDVNSSEIGKSSYWIKNRVRSMCGLNKEKKALMKEAIIYRTLAVHNGMDLQEVDSYCYELIKDINRR